MNRPNSPGKARGSAIQNHRPVGSGGNSGGKSVCAWSSPARLTTAALPTDGYHDWLILRSKLGETRHEREAEAVPCQTCHTPTRL
jgi:hypothetical protein